MIHTTQRPQRRTTPNDSGARRARASAARRRRSASISDAVIAAYIHDLRHAAAPKSAGA